MRRQCCLGYHHYQARCFHHRRLQPDLCVKKNALSIIIIVIGSVIFHHCVTQLKLGRHGRHNRHGRHGRYGHHVQQYHIMVRVVITVALVIMVVIVNSHQEKQERLN